MTQHQIYALLILPTQAAIFRLKDAQWEVERINGEGWSDLTKASPLNTLLRELTGRINHEHDLAQSEIHILVDDGAEAHLHSVPEALTQLQCTRWQILRLQPLRSRGVAISGTNPGAGTGWPDDWVCNALLPVLQGTFHYSDDALAQERIRVKQWHDEILDSLRADKKRLETELAALQTQIRALQVPDLAKLVSLLPAIYRNVWGRISAHDLALLAGGIRVPDIPSPFPEPSGDTLIALQRRLRSLPKSEQQQLHAFCRNLPHKLDVRSELRSWLEADTP